MYDMDISCYLVLLLTHIYILYQLHYQWILQRIIDSEYYSVKCILNLNLGFADFTIFRTFTIQHEIIPVISKSVCDEKCSSSSIIY